MKEISSYLKINKNFNKDKYYINLKNTCNNVVSDLKVIYNQYLKK